MVLVKIPKEEDIKKLLEIEEYNDLLVKIELAKKEKLVIQCHR